MTATFIFLMVALKVPIIGLFLIVRWAVKQTPETAGDGDGGIPRAPEHDPHPRPPRTPRPRRGPHAGPVPSPPPRVRSVTARGRELSET